MRLAYRTALLTAVTLTTISVTLPMPVEAQRICYRPDGSMYAGNQPPSDCSPDRPKSRDEAIERDAAAARTQQGVSKITAPTYVQDQLNRKMMKSERTRVNPAAAEQALRECDRYKYRPTAMDAQQSAICNRHWQKQADQTLRDADRDE